MKKLPISGVFLGAVTAITLCASPSVAGKPPNNNNHPAPAVHGPSGGNNNGGGQQRTFGGNGGTNRSFGGNNNRSFGSNGGTNRGFGSNNRGPNHGPDNRGFGANNRGNDHRGFGDDHRGFGADHRGFADDHRGFGDHHGFAGRVAGGGHYFYHGHSFARFRGGYYRWPHGYHYIRYGVGAFFPRAFWISDYYVTDYADYGLDAPPADYVWVRYGPDLVLFNQDTGEIAQVIPGAYEETADGGDGPPPGDQGDNQQ